MTDFVLVHGAWHGGWAWKTVRSLLETDGHEVWTPTLTGLGERHHLATRRTGLAVHVEDIINVFEFEDIARAVLVAHSYAGLPAAMAAQALADRVSRLIYLDAIIPRDGDSVFGLGAEFARKLRTASRLGGAGWLIPAPDDTFGIDDPIELARVRSKLTPQPLKTYVDRVSLARDQPPVRTSAIVCGLTRDVAAEEAAIAAGCAPVQWLRAGHDAMVTDPEGLVATLQSLAEAP